MGSRLYYATTTPAISPTQSASWNITTSFARGQLSSAKRNTAITTKTLTKTAADVHDQNRLLLQFVSRPLKAQTITGTIKGQILATEQATALGLHSQVIVRVLSNDGSTVTGTLYAGVTTTGEGINPTSEWVSATPTNSAMPRGGATALSSVTVTDRDRLVVELGYRVGGTITSNFSGSLLYGDFGTVDLPEDETDTDTTKVPWIEFSQTLLFYDDGRARRRIGMF